MVGNKTYRKRLAHYRLADSYERLALKLGIPSFKVGKVEAPSPQEIVEAEALMKDMRSAIDKAARSARRARIKKWFSQWLPFIAIGVSWAIGWYLVFELMAERMVLK